MALKAYEEFAPEPLVFPIGNKRYTVPPLGFHEGIKLQGVLAGTDHTLDGADPADGWRLVLGTAWDEMVEDNVPLEAIGRAGFTAMSDFQFGRTTAEHVWESGISPEALAAALAATQKASQGSQPSPSTASGNRTQRRAASKRTTSRTTSKATAAASQS